jgi:hypothetical protein
MKTYLVQRGTIKDRDFKKGFDSIVALDYMGASEYEWGTIPKSLETIRKNISDYQYSEIEINGKKITVFSDKKHSEKIVQFINDLAVNKFHLKCHSSFNRAINPSEWDIENFKRSPLETNFWWDLDNHLMFWLSDSTFEKKFKSIIAVQPKQD